VRLRRGMLPQGSSPGGRLQPAVLIERSHLLL
jgi:hypothetical protein